MKRGIRLRKILLFSFLIFLAGCAGSRRTASVEKIAKYHSFTVQDMLAMERISDAQVSPDGKWIAFVVQKIDLDADKGRSDIWLVGIDGSGLKQLTKNPENDSNPRWAPDSKTIFFLSARSGSSQVWKMRFDGGQANR